MKNQVLTAMSGKISERSRWSYLLTMPVFLPFFGYLFIGPGYFSTLKTFLGATIVNGVLVSLVFITQNQVSEYITRQYSSFRQTLKRILVSLSAHALLSGIFLLLVAGLYGHFRLFGSSLSYKTLYIMYGVNMAAIIITMSIRETFYSLEHWKHLEVNKERLRKENVHGQLQSLKAQVSPHFLFNSLNSLSTLIAEEPQKAEEFVDQMARVYRYLLMANHTSNSNAKSDGLTTLQNELVFIESYYHLLKTRYGDGMHLQLMINDQYLPHRLPPLTLQLLVENAVKHNVIRLSRPLTISISVTENGLLQVRNNLQKKTATPGLDKMESTQLGLANILTKYQLLAEYQPDLAEPVIENGPAYFTVTLPLIPKELKEI